MPANVPVHNELSDLTGTTWLLNGEQINTVLNNENRLNVNFTSNGVDFTSILTATGNSGDLYELYYGNTVAYGLDMEGDEYSSFGTWTYQAYRTIEITGGTDATNADLIEWLQANATQQTPVQPSAGGMYLGALGISKIFMGNSEVSKIYLGDALVTRAQQSPDNALLTADNTYLVDSTGGYLLTTEI